jgi:L-alanine-DL-glutamate epimerase-like enolase superfamily enzyme
VLRQHGVRLSLHGVGAGIGLATAVHVMSTTPNPDLYEYNRLLNPLRDDLLVQNVGFRDGEMVVPSGLGLGVAVSPEKAKRFLAGEARTVCAEKNS